MNKKYFILFLFLISLSFVNAWEFNGTIHDINGIVLNNSIINVTVRDMSFEIVGYNSTTSNSSGWFNLSVEDDSSWFYEPSIRHFQNNASDDGSNPIDFIGQSLPAFPYVEMSGGLSIDFYLRLAGTINITVINGTPGSFRAFNYQVKDQKLNFPVQESWTQADSALIYLPRDRNYSIMVYPNDSMPVSYDWNNFTSPLNYNLTISNISNYNSSSFTLHKQFNTTMSYVTVNGTIFNYSNGQPSSWNEFQVVAFLMEAGNVVYTGPNSMTFYNMSAWDNNKADILNNNTGYYNITVPGPVETTNFLLFATARNGTGYYGGYRNITPSYGDGSIEANFTMYPLMGSGGGWGRFNPHYNTINVTDPLNFGITDINTSKQAFNIVNSTNSTLNNIEATIEVKLDYSNYNATVFTFMSKTLQGYTSSNFYFPLINSTGIEEINVYSMGGAPKRVGKKTVQQILDGANNITLSSFNPGAINNDSLPSSIGISIYKSNSTCDVPSPPTACVLADSSTMSTFNPLSAIIGGGAISFRMGITSSGIEVHYVNVDMLASGPPDAAFDSSASETTSGSFDSAMRFGSGGPTIYDYVLVSMPYTAGSSSVAGLNESQDVNMSIPNFYDEDWNVVWNSTVNGTNGTALAGNYSHYSTYSSDWETLMSSNNCTTNVNLLNSSNPCYIDKTNNTIWIRLPHFSGTQPNIDGAVTTVTSAVISDSPASTGGSGTVSYWTLTRSITASEFEEGFTKDLGPKQRVKFSVGSGVHSMGVISMGGDSVIINISSTPQQATLSVGDLKKFDVTDDDYYDLSVKLESIHNNKANLTIKSINEKIVKQEEGSDGEEDVSGTEDDGGLE